MSDGKRIRDMEPDEMLAEVQRLLPDMEEGDIFRWAIQYGFIETLDVADVLYFSYHREELKSGDVVVERMFQRFYWKLDNDVKRALKSGDVDRESVRDFVFAHLLAAMDTFVRRLYRFQRDERSKYDRRVQKYSERLKQYQKRAQEYLDLLESGDDPEYLRYLQDRLWPNPEKLRGWDAVLDTPPEPSEPRPFRLPFPEQARLQFKDTSVGAGVTSDVFWPGYRSRVRVEGREMPRETSLDKLDPDVRDAVASTDPTERDAIMAVALLEEVLPLLPDREREVFQMKMDGYSHAEIAAELGIAEGTSQQTHHRAKKRVKRILQGGSTE